MSEKKEEAEEQLKEYLKQRNDLETPHQCTGEPIDPDVGVPLELIEEHTQYLTEMVEQLMKDMVEETRILEGTKIEDYASILQRENELSNEQKNTE